MGDFQYGTAGGLFVPIWNWVYIEMLNTRSIAADVDGKYLVLDSLTEGQSPICPGMIHRP